MLSPEGHFGAYALGWFDPVTRQGLMEPAGTHPPSRGQGLGRAAVVKVTRRRGDLGARHTVIRTRGTNRGAVALYTSAGYVQTGTLYDYARLTA